MKPALAVVITSGSGGAASYLRTSFDARLSFPRRSLSDQQEPYLWVHRATSAVVAPGGMSVMQLPQPLDRALRMLHVDFAPACQQPSAGRLLAATAASVAGSLAADALLVVIGQAAFSSTRGYAHFQFSDYSKLTVIGVVIACLAWPVVTRISSAPRWLFLRMAVAVTLVLWIPDIYILALGQPPKAVAVLFVMHLAIAVVTYNCLVHLARTKPLTMAPAPVPPANAGRPR